MRRRKNPHITSAWSTPVTGRARITFVCNRTSRNTRPSLRATPSQGRGCRSDSPNLSRFLTTNGGNSRNWPPSELSELGRSAWRKARKKAVIRVSCLVFRENPLAELGVAPEEMSDGQGNRNLHFSPPDGRSTRYDRQDFVALACRAQRTVQVRLRAPSGSRLALTALSPTSLRRVVRNTG